MNHPSLGDLRRRARARTSASSARGQSLVEFGLILPLMVLIAVAVGDFGRIYASMIALESATREAADYGAFDEDYWDTTPEARTAALDEMKRRACTAASSMPGYQAAAAPTHCTNPLFVFDVDSETTADYGEGPIRVVMARGTFTFTTAISFPPLPESVTIVRESRFAVWKVNPLEAEGSPDPSIPAPSDIPTPTPEPTPTATPTPDPGATPTPTPDPGATPTPEPSGTPDPGPTPTPPPDPTSPPDPTPTPTSDPKPTPTPTPSPTPEPTPDPNEPRPSQ